MSTVYDAEAAINQAIADRARIPGMIDAAMKAHGTAPTAQGALSLARAVAGYILLANVSDPAGWPQGRVNPRWYGVVTERQAIAV